MDKGFVYYSVWDIMDAAVAVDRNPNGRYCKMAKTSLKDLLKTLFEELDIDPYDYDPIKFPDGERIFGE
jgi:hypothetical protein